jgi:hypothetical protein
MKLLSAALAVLVLGACGGPPPPPGTPLDIRMVSERGPRIPNGGIFASADLVTLRSLIDAVQGGLAGQVGGTVARHACLAPYADCWADVTSQSPGQAYLAVDVRGGFCVTEGTPQLGVSGTHLELQIPFSDVFNCHVSGSLALPTATLFSFPTGRLNPGLYSASFVLQYSNDTYRSASTYLSIPGPAAGLPADMDREAADALTSVLGAQRAGMFSMSRVDGAQLGRLCGTTVAGPAYLVTYEADPGGSVQRMTVALAGPTPRTCATTRV